MMFYRGISHHEADAEWIWAAPDGTRVLASRFALYARYNWYYLVHRPVTVGSVFERITFRRGADVAFRFADGLARRGPGHSTPKHRSSATIPSG